MKYFYLLILACLGLTIHLSYAETTKAKAEQKKFKLIDAFKSMAGEVKKVFAPKAKPLKQTRAVKVSSSYDVRQHSIITSHRLDQIFTGVMKGKGQKLIDEARKNNLCPIFFAAVCAHESDIGKSYLSRNNKNVFGTFIKGKYHTFSSVDESIEYTAKSLGRSKLYAGGGNHTILGIQQTYCPIGAGNDPKKINKYWLGGVMDWMVKIWGKEVFIAL